MKNQDEKGLLFGIWQMQPDTWVITNRWQNFMYLLIGQEKAMLIDTGYGEGNLREVVERITDKPVMVINTHGHFDHTGGNALWEQAWMTPQAVAQAREPFSPQQAQWYAAKPYQDYTVNLVSDGDEFDLGGRTVEVISIPAHNESSIALLDHGRRLLFCGDELEAGQVLLFVRSRNIALNHVVAAHLENMKKLKARRAEYDAICPAHNGTPLTPDLYLDDFIALAQELLAGTAEISEDTAGFGFTPDASKDPFFSRFGKLLRARHGQASFVFMQEKEC